MAGSANIFRTPSGDILDGLANPLWFGLNGKHRSFALIQGDAARYPASMAPFAALRTPSGDALRQLAGLMQQGESVWVKGVDFPPAQELAEEEQLQVLQMAFPQDAPLPASATGIEPLSVKHRAEMLALTEIAFPDFFRERTCEMGDYFGIRSASGRLIALCGERMAPPGATELSGICTHPDHRGKGHAASLIAHVLRKHRSEGIRSWLHVTTTNISAISLYTRMGFAPLTEVTYTRLSRL